MNIKTPVDMHMHTNASDGFFEPIEVLKLVRQSKLNVFSVTDHDSVAALDEINRKAQIFEMRLINGVELSAEYGGRDVHLLGYFIDHHSKRFLDYLYLFRRRRYQRAQEMVEKLAKKKKSISMNRIEELAGNGPIGRPHLADVLIEKGYVKTRQEAFDEYLKEGSEYYVEKYKIGAEEVIELIHSIGGAVFVAHPSLSSVSEKDVRALKKLGLDGVECVHPAHSPEDAAKWLDFAEKNKMLVSGGSDFHGDSSREEVIGDSVVDLEYVNRIEAYCEKKRSEWIITEETEDEEIERLRLEDIKISTKKKINKIDPEDLIDRTGVEEEVDG